MTDATLATDNASNTGSEPTLARWRRKLREKGLKEIILGRLRWYKLRFQMDNWLVGKFVELTGNKVKAHGATISVDNPLVTTRHKSTMFFGIYETGEFELSEKYMDRSLPTVELGGSIGGVACGVSRLLKDPSKHVVVEANPVLLPTLEKNRALNDAKFAIEPAAVGYGGDTLSFTVVDHFMKGGIQVSGQGRTVTVPTVTLGAILEKYGFGVINLISDCEGAEVDMIDKEPELMKTRVKHLIIETHEEHLGDAPVERMLKQLADLGFETLERTRGDVLALVNRNL